MRWYRVMPTNQMGMMVTAQFTSCSGRHRAQVEVLRRQGGAQAVPAADGVPGRRQRREEQPRQQHRPLHGVGVDDRLQSAEHRVADGDGRDGDQGEEHGVQAPGRGVEHGGRGQLGARQDLSAGEAQVAHARDDRRQQGGAFAVTPAQQVRVGEHGQVRVHALDPGDQHHRGEPGAHQAGEQQPAAGQAHGEAQAAQADGEAAAHVGGHHRHAHVGPAHVAAAHVVVVQVAVAPEVVEAHREHAQHVDGEDPVVQQSHARAAASGEAAPSARHHRFMDSQPPGMRQLFTSRPV